MQKLFGKLKSKTVEYIVDSWQSFKWRRLRRFEILFSYLKQGWKQEDWDGHYIMDDLHFKIKRVRDHISGHNRFVGCEKVVAKMDEALALLDKLMHHDYGEKYDKIMEEKYGYLRMYTEMCPREKHSTAVVILRDAERSNPEIHKKVSKDMLAFAEAEAKDRKDDLRKVFRLIANNIDKWWD